MLLNSCGELETSGISPFLNSVGAFTTEFLLLSLVSFQKGSACLGERYAPGMTLTVFLRTRVSMSRAT